MTQGFRPTKPAFLDPLQSQPMRDNFNALATCNAGATSPADPSTGWLWLDTSAPANYRLRMYLLGTWVIILNNLLGGFPVQGGATSAVFTQGAPSLTWAIIHNLGTPSVAVSLWDDSVSPAQMMLADTIEYVSDNEVLATFLSPQLGRAVIVA